MSEIITTSTDILSWNIKSGGFADYKADAEIPEREDVLRTNIYGYHHLYGIDTVTLTDAYRWHTQYGGDDGIAHHLGYQSARFVELQDQRLAAGMGIAFATDKPIEQSAAVDLGTRQGLSVVLGIGRYGLQIANVYLDDLSESLRSEQVRALMSGLEPDVPTLLLGDWNFLRPDELLHGLNVKARNLAVKSLAAMLPTLANKMSKARELEETICGMNERTAMSLLRDYGYTDADAALTRPTAPAKLPIFGIDYAFHNRQVVVEDFTVQPNDAASDHRAVTLRAHVAA